MTLGYVLDYRKPESGASGRLRARFIDSIEALEHASGVLLRDSDTGVGYRQHNRPLRISGHTRFNLDIDLTSGTVISNCVVYEVIYKLGQLAWRREQLAGLALERQADIVTLRADVEYIHALLADRVQIDRFEILVVGTPRQAAKA